MSRKRRQEKILREQTQERFERNERAGKDIYARIAELRNIPRENLPEAVFMLSMAAKHQSEQIRQSIKDDTRYDFDLGALTDGDLATYLAEGTGYALRDHVTNPPTFLDVMSEKLPDVHFTIAQQDAVSMVAAMIREQRLEGILEGLRLAGLLNEAPKRNRIGPQTNGVS
jgi:ATP-dependent Clp protease ATP-binding subunit ClpA